MNKYAVDTNILVYLHETTPSAKKNIAESIVLGIPVVSVQVISEYLNVLKRILKLPKLRLIEHSIVLLEDCEIINLDKAILEHARKLIQRYDFQLFDSIIIASALAANCSILYSEDLQHKQLIENRLTIINPFL
ncbi:PIN domain-containing protein [Dyadobacter subterraneus]|uniref:PIN domain-containing protein n=1 Tax=Dyadobacter subterraneus TaxID=2773304 RepID=A0ABR9W8F4_9BACT|nr:PIN domain-containing protein [Dyadobacter subterraneus]MBE9461753.1 PIN domain-containing protein [Dyadobacter subterraneus]